MTVYLDNAATTHPKPECVYNHIDFVARNKAVNSGRGAYTMSRDATSVIDEARELVAEVMNANSGSVVFTPSATIALNQIIYGLTYDKYKKVYVSPFEHNSVLRPLKLMQDKYGFEIIILPFDGKTQGLEISKMTTMFAEKKPDYLFITHISNVTGLVLPVQLIAEKAKSYGSINIMDCSQSAGLLDIDMTNIDYAVFAGHKTLYGVFGCGGYINNNSKAVLSTVIAGGTGTDSLNLDMPNGPTERYEAASHNIIAISSLCASIKWIKDIGIGAIQEHEKDMTDYLVEGLKTIKGIDVLTPSNRDSHIGIVSFCVNGYQADDIGIILDQDFDIAVRCGYHCAAFAHSLLNTERKKGTVRASVGYFTTKDHIDRLIEALREL